VTVLVVSIFAIFVFSASPLPLLPFVAFPMSFVPCRRLWKKIRIQNPCLAFDHHPRVISGVVVFRYFGEAGFLPTGHGSR
jgi:hypothetical protein